MENSEQNTLKISEIARGVLTSEVKFVLGIVLFVGGVVAPYYNQQQDIALIKQSISNINSNHEQHIQDILQELKEMKQTEIELQKQIYLIQK